MYIVMVAVCISITWLCYKLFLENYRQRGEMGLQAIADSLLGFLPTHKMVNAIYAQARVKPEPVPL